ncbi:MAG: protein YgfX [Methylococcaceae bacterium]
MNSPTHQYEEPLLLQPKPSRRLQQIIVAIHVLALSACLLNSLAIVIKFSLLGGVCGHLWFIIKRLNRDLYAIKHSEASGWEIAKNDNFQSVSILPSTTVTKFAVFLHFKQPKDNAILKINQQTTLVLYDALDDDDYRRFVVRLKTSFIKQEQTLLSINKA